MTDQATPMDRPPTDADLAEVMRDVVALTTAVDGDDMDAAWRLIESYDAARLHCVLFTTAGFLGAAFGIIDDERPAELPPLLMEFGLKWAARGVA